MRTPCWWIVVVAAVLPAAGWGQGPLRNGGRPLAVEELSEPPVPADPLELVEGNAEAVRTPEQRQAAIDLLNTARASSNVRGQPYYLVTTFQSFGSSASDGAWSLDDMSPSGTLYRWSAQGPGYSAIHLYSNRLLYTDRPSTVIPLRLAQVREAIFFTYPAVGPYASLRTASASLDGVQLNCILAAPGLAARHFSGGRNWEESEYCVDPNSRLLVTYSPAPGVYVRYDYANAIPFHGKTIPGGFTISEFGRPILEAKTQSVSDPGNVSPALFETSGLTPVGVGSIMTPAAHVRRGQRGASGALHMVELRGISTPDGQTSEIEVLASTNAALNEAALEWANRWQQPANQPQNGSTPQSHEIFFLYEAVQ